MTTQRERQSASMDDLHAAVSQAEMAARRAHDLSYDVRAPLWMRLSLGRAQSILMHYVVKYAGDGS